MTTWAKNRRHMPHSLLVTQVKRPSKRWPERCSSPSMLMQSSPRGFTLIEIMLVVAIIGILAAMGSFEYDQYTARAKRIEAYAMLTNIRTAMIGFRTEHDRFGVNFNEIGFEVKGGTSPNANTRTGGRYTYQLATSPQGWCATAFGNIDHDPFVDIVVIGDDC